MVNRHEGALDRHCSDDLVALAEEQLFELLFEHVVDLDVRPEVALLSQFGAREPRVRRLGANAREQRLLEFAHVALRDLGVAVADQFAELF